MWTQVINVIIKYWLEFFFGLIVAGGGIFFKRYTKLSKEEKKKEQRDQIEALKKENANIVEAMLEISNKNDEKLQTQIDTIVTENKNLKAGLLSMQGKEFKDDCRVLLREGHTITLEEWEEIDADHEAYNGLGGNHTGDQLYELVKTKFENTLK